MFLFLKIFNYFRVVSNVRFCWGCATGPWPAQSPADGVYLTSYVLGKSYNNVFHDVLSFPINSGKQYRAIRVSVRPRDRRVNKDRQTRQYTVVCFVWWGVCPEREVRGVECFANILSIWKTRMDWLCYRRSRTFLFLLKRLLSIPYATYFLSLWYLFR